MISVPGTTQVRIDEDRPAVVGIHVSTPDQSYQIGVDLSSTAAWNLGLLLLTAASRADEEVQAALRALAVE